MLLGVARGDTHEEAAWIARKIAKLRVFPDDAGKMNRDLAEHGGAVLLVSQFTLHASTAKGNRPSYIRAARPDQAVPLYLRAKQLLCELIGRSVASGEFGADMQVSLVNDGPVTIVIDSEQRD